MSVEGEGTLKPWFELMLKVCVHLNQTDIASSFVPLS